MSASVPMVLSKEYSDTELLFPLRKRGVRGDFPNGFSTKNANLPHRSFMDESFMLGQVNCVLTIRQAADILRERQNPGAVALL